VRRTAATRIAFSSLLVAFLASVIRAVEPTPPAAPPSGYRVLRQITVGGEGGWDYAFADSEARRLYVSHGTRVLVFDLDTEKPVGEIPDTPGVHGIAICADLHRGFTSNGAAASVTIFDTRTLAKIGSVQTTGENPDAILYDPASRRVFTFNGRSSNATSIDVATGKATGTIALGGKPEFAVSDGAGRVYVNLEDRSELLELDPRALQVRNRWPLAPCEEPTGLSLDARKRRLFVGCHNRLMAVVDADRGRVLTTLPIGQGVDAAAFDPGTSLAFASNGDGSLTIVHEDGPDTFRVVENVATRRGARTMAIDLKTHRVYLPTADFGPPPTPSSSGRRTRPSIVPGSFRILVVGR
jgi:DNA-binding beta-propeller fold protein YncE